MRRALFFSNNIFTNNIFVAYKAIYELQCRNKPRPFTPRTASGNYPVNKVLPVAKFGKSAFLATITRSARRGKRGITG